MDGNKYLFLIFCIFFAELLKGLVKNVRHKHDYCPQMCATSVEFSREMLREAIARTKRG